MIVADFRISSSEVRAKSRNIRLGVVGKGNVAEKFIKECRYVNGVTTIHDNEDFEDLVSRVDAVYIYSHPSKHFYQVKYALEHKKHVLCEMPLTLSAETSHELYKTAETNGCILFLGCKTAYSTAFQRMVLLAMGGVIGDIVSVDSVCTSLRNADSKGEKNITDAWNSLNDWGPIALLPVFQLLGTDYKKKYIVSRFSDEIMKLDDFTKCSFVYPSACASIKVGNGAKSEGELIISGTKGYIYVPAPWWKTDYFEIRRENSEDTRRYFYQLEGEGIRYEIVAFIKAIQHQRPPTISQEICIAVSKIMEDFDKSVDLIKLQ